MSQSAPDPDGRPVRLVKDGVTFVSEQDGLPEREFKGKLSSLFARYPTVQRAYLTVVRYPGSSADHVALCVKTANGEDATLVGEIGAAFQSVFGSHEHLDTLFLQGLQETQVAAVCKPFFGSAPPRQGAADFSPRMPEVDVPPDLEDRFARARRIASGDESAPDPAGPPQGQRRLVIVTPGRMCVLHKCPPPGSMQASAVAAIEKIAPASKPLSIAVIAFTELRALRAGLAKAIPFAGYLLGLAYVGHAVVVFEGHPSALRAGCRDADLVIVDEAMIPVLQGDWLSVAWSVMRAPQALVFDRNGSLKRLTKK